jgi:23S rRNA pseudouridine1911/1915/1917 synthase
MKVLSIAVREDAMVPLDRWLATELSERLGRPVPRGLVRKAIVSGVVAIAGRIVKDPGTIPRRGPSVFVRHFDWLPDPERAPVLRVLHEDDAVIVVDKPSGLAMHGNLDAHRPSLGGLVEKHVGRAVFVHHRLDAGTSGVVLFAKAPEANAELGRSFATREVEKTYVAVVVRPPVDWPERMTADSNILVADNGSVRVDSAGKPAQTRLRVLERLDGRLLVEAKPVTGRKHQIRVHLAALGAPIVGDTRYGGPPADRLMLHAERIELDHPVTRARLDVSSPRPEGFGVRAALRRARRSHLSAGGQRQGTQGVPSRPLVAPPIEKSSRKGSPPQKRRLGKARGSRR